jgi:hypothetical protein
MAVLHMLLLRLDAFLPQWLACFCVLVLSHLGGSVPFSRSMAYNYGGQPCRTSTDYSCSCSFMSSWRGYFVAIDTAFRACNRYQNTSDETATNLIFPFDRVPLLIPVSPGRTTARFQLVPADRHDHVRNPTCYCSHTFLHYVIIFCPESCKSFQGKDHVLRGLLGGSCVRCINVANFQSWNLFVPFSTRTQRLY